VAIEGGELDERGFVIDYAELEGVVNPLIELVDHKFLNDVPGLSNPTSEIIVQWFMNGIKSYLPGYIITLRLYETPCYWVEHTA
jgi:6-pyruvoyltetrahydropterin/6-carboxytetrahydropterin synthase